APLVGRGGGRVEGDDGRRVALQDRVGMYLLEGEQRVGRARQRDLDGLVRPVNVVVGDVERDRLHGLAGQEGERAGRQGVVRAVDRGAAGGRVVDGHRLARDGGQGH